MSKVFDINRLMQGLGRTYFGEIERDRSYNLKMKGIFVSKLPSGNRTLLECIYTEPRPSFKDYDEDFTIYALDILSPRNDRNFRALTGGIAHEMAHLVAFREGMPEPHNEKEIDNIVIGKGLGLYLLAIKNYLLEWNPNFKFSGYTPEEVNLRMKNVMV